jgi:hypothetical protein
MPIPETTSPHSFARFVGGKLLRVGEGKAWREVNAWVTSLPSVDSLMLPSVSEPFLAWTISGEVEFQEREGNRPWIAHRVKKGSLFLTTGGGPYECRWKALTSEPFESMGVFLGLPLLERALEEVFGADATLCSAARCFRVHRRLVESVYGSIAPRVDAKESQPAVRARHRPSNSHPFGSHVRRSDQRA